jgi:hypothetical protein
MMPIDGRLRSVVGPALLARVRTAEEWVAADEVAATEGRIRPW